MKMKTSNRSFNNFFFVVQILFIFTTPILSKKIGDLNNVLKPFMIKADRNRIYISDQYFVSSYSIEKFIFLIKIGGRGEGPAQFLIKPKIKVLNNGILLHSPYRSVFYSKNGDFLKQFKFDGKFFEIDCVKDNYIVKQLDINPKRKRYRVTNLVVMDPNFKEVKVIHSKKKVVLQPTKKKKSFLVKPVFKFQSFEEKIYVAKDSERKILIDVFDHNGKHLHKIQKEWGRIKIPEAYKKRKLDEFKNHPVVKKRWTSLSRYYDYTFPEYFPAIADFHVRDGKIYIKTYKSGRSGVEFIVLDLQGKGMASSYLPDIKDTLYDIKNNHIYFLEEDEDNEVWELHSIKIQ